MDRQKFLSVFDIPTKAVNIPDWGSFFIRKLNIADQKYLEAFPSDDPLTMARVCARVMVEQDGAQILTDDDAPVLLVKNPDNFQLLVKEVNDFCFPHADNEEQAKNS